ncbi:L-aspartate oxidase [Thiomicrorhabdus sp. 6S3-12]|uniref:L-aspartate oxidase n=1 Tax=Thiomicrorhabdus sp. 6S3-12 TaxID=2819681 RepID=UPI001AAC6A4B|nr:L-aspartate oxidase [Thiomicrorhabdus sp. 6S3-12]MBO1924129.1 L-aspartate oxidase [Thiomicrorhabdus sp. 6S3-12]
MQQSKANQEYAKSTEVLIIGSGIAGLSIALKLAQEHKVIVLAKASLEEGSTSYAQGGIAGVLDPFDSIDAHIKDTKIAGAGLCDDKAVAVVATHAAETILELIEYGVNFTTEGANAKNFPYHLTKEGGHSHRRVIHVADHTGQSVADTLINQVKKHPNIELLPEHISIDLILNRKRNRCMGAYVLNKNEKQVYSITAPFTVLATGGASKAYLYTSNPDTSTGDGVAMAWRAGCRVANMEFNQFHPTCLFHPKDRSFLISEAVRGEGGILRLPDGTAFMQEYDPRADLAPRDIVARAIDQEMKKHGIDCVYLDITHKPAKFVKQHFPTIYQRCKEDGIDITKEQIPVVPAAHYTCGGVMTNLEGKTDLEGLYAIGETAYTGLHGANRLASNSLAEGLVFAKLAHQSIEKSFSALGEHEFSAKPWDTRGITDPKEKVLVSHDWDELRRVMWDYVGIVRTNKRLKRALKRIRNLQAEINEYYSQHTLSSDLLELRNLTMVAELMVLCAQKRKESRGLHYNLDYPKMFKTAKPTVLKPQPGKNPTSRYKS